MARYRRPPATGLGTVNIAGFESEVLTLGVLYIPVLRELFGLHYLPLADLAVLTLLGPTVILAAEGYKRFFGVRMASARGAETPEGKKAA